MSETKGQIFSAIDIGSTKVVVAVASLSAGKLDILGLGKADNRGVKQGQIINIDATVQAIQNARDEAELMSGKKIQDVYMSVGGEGAQCVSTMGLAPIADQKVTAKDIQNVLRVAKAVSLPESKVVLHTLPQKYTIDGQTDISTPDGMSGIRLEVNALLVTMPKKSVQNSQACIEKAGLTVKGSVLQQMASADAVVLDDEKDLGVAVVDMGGGTCDIVVYREGMLSNIGTVPVGGLNFTQDVAVGIKTPLASAEALKIKSGSAMVDMVDKEEELVIEGLGEVKEKTVTRGQLCQILEARAEETLSLVFQQLTDWDVLKDLGAGLVLTGGASQLHGLVELGEFTFDVPVRTGTPTLESSHRDLHPTPLFSTVVGMLNIASGEKGPAKPAVPSAKKTETVSDRWEKFKTKLGKTFSI